MIPKLVTNIEWVDCIVCKRPFPRRKNSKRKQLPGFVRPARSITCCHVHSEYYVHHRQTNRFKKERRERDVIAGPGFPTSKIT